jgi:hypothetical protein
MGLGADPPRPEPLSWVGNACVERGENLVEQEIIVPPCGEAAIGTWQFEVVTCPDCKGQGTIPSRYLTGQPDPPCPGCQGRKTVTINVRRKQETGAQAVPLALMEHVAESLESLARCVDEEAGWFRIREVSL